MENSSKKLEPALVTCYHQLFSCLSFVVLTLKDILVVLRLLLIRPFFFCYM